jgi:hypothetical protein
VPFFQVIYSVENCGLTSEIAVLEAAPDSVLVELIFSFGQQLKDGNVAGKSLLFLV